MATEAREPVLEGIGNYDLLEKIADGGMGSVYKGRHRQTGQIVAIKVVAAHMAGNEVLLKRFEQEYNAARQLDHPNIVRALEFGDTGSRQFMVMEFVDGASLGRKIEREGRIPERDAIKIIGQIAQALHRAHKEKLIHRDVKPDNILVMADSTAKLTDLGLVKEVEAEVNLTRTGRGLGTPHFMAPEQFKNAKNVDPRCDIYSLGATLYMMVTGDLPFKSTGPLDAYMKKIENKLVPPRQIVPTLSDRIDWAIRRAMSADPEQRPSSCREFVEDLTGKSTRKMPVGEGVPGQQDIWYLVYQDEEGTAHTVKGSAAGIRRSLKEGLLGDASNIRASRKKSGGFEPLRCFPEFRDLVVLPTAAPAAAPVDKSPSRTAASRKRPVASDEPTIPQQPVLTPDPTSSLQMPHIPLDQKSSGAWPAWVQLGILLLLLVGSAAAGFFFLFKGK
jgi:serine/threonine protein kinase